MDRIELIRRSFRCFTFGLLGLIPLLGLTVAGLALGEFIRTNRRAAGQWNPARAQLHWGLAFACISLALPVAAVQLLLSLPFTKLLLAALWT